MRLLAGLLPFLRPRRTEDGPVPQLLPEWRERQGRRPGSGVHLRRLGGARVLTARGNVPRLRGIEAIRGYCLSPLRVKAVQLLLDGIPVGAFPTHSVEPGTETPPGKYVFNIWYDFRNTTPGLHRLTVRPAGLPGRLHSRSRRILVEPVPPLGEAPDSDAFVPRASSDPRSPEAIVAALPSEVRGTRRSPLPDPIRSILVTRADQLGDLAISMPALRRLRDLFPDAQVVGLLTAANADFARATELFDEVIVADYPEGAGRRTMSLDEQDRLKALFARHAFDIAIDFGEGAQSRLLLLLSGARFLYGFRHGDHPWLSASFELNARDSADGLETIPPSRKLLALVESLGVMRAAEPEPMVLRTRDEALLANYGISPIDRFVILHLGARLTCSRWPGFFALAELLLARTDVKLLVFTHGEHWNPPAHSEARLQVVDRMLPFADFDALLANCAVLVGNDSGPKHLAALRGTKVVSVHMARLNWSEWGQEGEGLIVSRRVPCAGCNIGDQPDECGRDYTCIRSITPEEVFAAVTRLL